MTNPRRLRGYAPGDPLRPEDAALCHSEEGATTAAARRLRPGVDGAFVLRSDGAFTYALYEGRWSGDGSSFLFRLDGEGNFKVVADDALLCARVRIPAPPAGERDEAPRRSSVKCDPTSCESTRPSRRRFSYAPGQRMGAVPEARHSQRTEEDRSREQGEADANSRGKGAPRRSSVKCRPTFEPTRPSRRRFSYAPGRLEDLVPEGTLRPTKSLPSRRCFGAESKPRSDDPIPVKSRSFSVGDVVPKERMPRADRSEMARAVSRLGYGDTAFVKRSCGKAYSYSAVARRDSESVTFRVSAAGDTKTFPLARVGKFVIVLQEGDAENFMTVADAAAQAREELSSEDSPEEEDEDDEADGGSTAPPPPSARPPASLVPPQRFLPASLVPPQRFGPSREDPKRATPPFRRPSSRRAGGAADPGDAPRRDSKFSSGTSVTSLCSVGSDGSDAFHGSERAVCGGAVDPPGGRMAGEEPPRVPSPGPSSPRRRGARVVAGGDGGPRPAAAGPVAYEAGTRVLYRGADGTTEARILAAHRDDELVPYYTIELAGGRERQTDGAHILAAVR